MRRSERRYRWIGLGWERRARLYDNGWKEHLRAHTGLPETQAEVLLPGEFRTCVNREGAICTL